MPVPAIKNPKATWLPGSYGLSMYPDGARYWDRTSDV